MYDLYLQLTNTSLKGITLFVKVIGYFAMAIPMATSSVTFVVTGDIKLSHCLIRLLYTFYLTDAHKTELTGKSVKGKRHRTAFTLEQLQTLEAEFEKQQYLVGNER